MVQAVPMRLIGISLLIFISATVGKGVEISDLSPAEQIVIKLTGRMDARRLPVEEVQRLVGGHQNEVIALLRQVEAGRSSIHDFNVFDANARVMLFKLNDRPTVEEIMPAFRQYRSGQLGFYGGDIVDSMQPLLINDLAENLFLPASAYEEYKRESRKHVSDVIGPDPEFYADELIILLVRDGDRFSKETRDWAGVMRPNLAQPELTRKILRAWWNENKSFFQNGNFEAVRPGTLPSPEKRLPSN